MAVNYLRAHQGPEIFEGLLSDILKERPENLTEFVATWSMTKLSASQRYQVAEETLEHRWAHSLENLGEDSSLARYSAIDVAQITDAKVAAKTVKIICTIGPKTQSVEGITKLLQNGMDIARMNFSHGSHEYHKKTIECVRKASEATGKIVAIALDTKGPEIRTGKMLDGQGLILSIGDKIRVSTNPENYSKGTKEVIYMDYPSLCKKVSIGGMMYVDDGLLGLKILQIGEDYVDCVVMSNHILTDLKGCNLAKVNVDLPAVSEKDEADLKFAVSEGVDMIFASFIRNADQVRHIRQILGDAGKDVLIISKIENHQGLHHIDEIIQESDGIMVARGDLGIEISPEKLFLAQKMIISKCNIVGKPVICATQMLESMTTNPRPLRAEANDVANAILDGAHCVMLSGETAKGDYPSETVNTMASICRVAQTSLDGGLFFRMMKEVQFYPMSIVESICSSVIHCVMEQGAKVIVCCTKTGTAARMLAKYTQHIPIVAVCQEMKWARRLCLLRCVIPIVTTETGREERLALGLEHAQALKIVQPGQSAVYLLADHKTGLGQGNPNMLRVVQVI
eukprot:PhF_6_TR6053/c0_g1_i1/m.8769/K00873/PK, pyk; pyruvate kinase